MPVGAETLERGTSHDLGTPSRPELLARWATRVPWLWPALLALLISGYQLGQPLLWRDEIHSWALAVDPLHDTIANTLATNPAQLAYSVFLHAWIAVFGDSAPSMRMPSVLCMAGAAAIVTLIGRRLAGIRAGLAAGLVFALVPSVARFGQEVRYYAPQVLLASVALLLLLRALDAPSPRRWALYALSIAACGYVDLVALSMLAGHVAIVALRCGMARADARTRADARARADSGTRSDTGIRAGARPDGTTLTTALGFALAVAAGAAACLPVITSSLSEAHSQVGWLPKPGLDLSEISFFARNLFFSTSVAAVVLVLAVLAWVAWRPAAQMTAMAVLPPAGVWLLSQGPESYFFARYLEFTVIAWAVLAGIALSRVSKRIMVAGLLLIAVCAAGDQRVIRETGAHDWATYPTGPGGYYWDYASAARYIARYAEPSDGIAYPSAPHLGWQLIGPGVQYYLRHDLPARTPMPHEEFLSRPGTEFGQIKPAWCRAAAACFGSEPRVWVVGAGNAMTSPARALNSGQAAVLDEHYRVTRVGRFRGVTVFELTRVTRGR